MGKELLSIGEVAKLLSVSIDTLRRWDKSGKLKPTREAGARGHRYYLRRDIEAYQNDLLALARGWITGSPKIPDEYYCSNSAVFQSRLIKLQGRLGDTEDEGLKRIFSLIVAVAGEIGNNSFDHNLGNWPDVSGIFFGFDINKRQIVLADRGQGILTTLKRAKPELRSHSEALRVAFTEVVSGRAPEERGNGLKFVKNVVENNPMQIVFETGDAGLEIKQGVHDLVIKKVVPSFRGCLASIKF